MEPPVSPEFLLALETRTRNFLTTADHSWNSDRVRRAARDMAQEVLDAIKEIRLLQTENTDLHTAIRRQAAAVKMSESARKQIDAYERKTLTSLAGQDRAAVLEELAAARDEASRWNAEATQMEGQRDALVTAAREYLDAQHDKFDAETDPRVTKAQFETYRQRYDDTREALEKLITPRKDTGP